MVCNSGCNRLRKEYPARRNVGPKVAVASSSFAVRNGECFGLLGGLASNNPTLDTLVEVNREITAINKTVEDDEEKESISVIVSIGTGNQPVIKSRATDRLWPTNALDAYKSITATVELAKMFVDTVCEADRWVICRARSWCEMAGIKYYRLNPQLTSEVVLDETDNDKLFQLMWESRKYVNQHKEYIREIVQQIL